MDSLVHIPLMLTLIQSNSPPPVLSSPVVSSPSTEERRCRLKRTFDYVYNNETSQFALDCPTDMPPSSGTQSSTRSKTLSYSNASEFTEALYLRGVLTSSSALPKDRSLGLDLTDPETTSDNHECLRHAMHTRTIASNETTYYLLFEFLVTGWLWKIASLRYVINAQWRIDPLQAIVETPHLTSPKPDITVGYDLSSLTAGSSIPPPIKHSAPVVSEPNLVYPCVTIEVKPFERPHWHKQNLHSGALMLRQLRSLWAVVYGETSNFDNVVRALTFSISRNVVEGFGHWTVVDQYSMVTYRHSLVFSWALGNRGEEWQTARGGLKQSVEWITQQNGWIKDALSIWRERF